MISLFCFKLTHSEYFIRMWAAVVATTAGVTVFFAMFDLAAPEEYSDVLNDKMFEGNTLLQLTAQKPDEALDNEKICFRVLHRLCGPGQGESPTRTVPQARVPLKGEDI